jgi:hypothetical protein
MRRRADAIERRLSDHQPLNGRVDVIANRPEHIGAPLKPLCFMLDM